MKGKCSENALYYPPNKELYPTSLQGFFEAVSGSKGLQTFKNQLSNLAFVQTEIRLSSQRMCQSRYWKYSKFPF